MFYGELHKIRFKHVLFSECGFGFLAKEFARKFPHAKITAIDNNKDKIRTAIRINKYPNIFYDNKNIFSLNKNNKYDMIITNECLSFLDDEKLYKFLTTAKTLTRKTFVALNEWNIEYSSEKGKHECSKNSKIYSHNYKQVFKNINMFAYLYRLPETKYSYNTNCFFIGSIRNEKNINR